MDSELLCLTEDDAGNRLDKVLSSYFNGSYSRTYFQYLLDQGLILLNGESVKKRTKVQAGDEVEIRFIATPEMCLTPEPIPLNILYEDEYLLAINKPAGMVTHPAPGHYTGTFVHGLLFHCKELEAGDSLRPGIVHRLDKETSGVLLAAKSLVVQQKLVALFSQREVYKEYLAICLGIPPSGEVNAPIGRHPVNRKAMAVVSSGRPAISFIQTVRSHDNLSLIKIILKTGRTHQIRVHLKHLGFPILGDSLYGTQTLNRKYNCERQLLHARCLRFNHPITGQLVDLEAALPQDMSSFLSRFSLGN